MSQPSWQKGQCLLDSALDPIVEEAIKGKAGTDAEKAILALRVCDPAVGSGHFLVGAAHRLARHLARVRANAQGESEPSPLLYQHALRDVIGRCLYGVDINPMAAELCRVSLWLEALEPGKPLSFLDHHVRVGNSLLGATPELIAAGLPDNAFAPTDGDDKKACAVLKKRNKDERKGIGPLFADQDAETQARLQHSAAALDELPDNRPEDISAKRLAFRKHEQTEDYRHKKQLADAWCAAFVVKKYFREPGRNASANGITQGHLNDLTAGRQLPADLAAEVEQFGSAHLFFHWHLAFPDVFAKGGFDCVLGNPPWVRQELFKPMKNLLSVYSSFSSTADLSVFFLELSVNILNPSGRAAALTPNKWFRSAYGEPLRDFLKSSARLRVVIDFGHAKNLFGDADTFPACTVASRVPESLGEESTLRFVRAFDEDRKQHSLSELVAMRGAEVSYSALVGSGWAFNDTRVSGILQRMRENSVSLTEFVGRTPLYGIKTGLNEAFYLDDSSARMIKTNEAQSTEMVKALIRGRDIKRWNVAWADQWQIVIESSQNRPWSWAPAHSEEEAEAVFARAHPLIHAHLKRFEAKLRQRTDSGVYWWELRSCDYYGLFARPKIAVSLISFHSAIALDDVGYFQNNSTVMIPSDDLFVLALLNSRIGWWYMSLTFPHMKDEALAMEADYLGRFPVPKAAEPLVERIRKLCCEARQMAKQPGAGLEDRLIIEQELSNLVCDAYGLSAIDAAILDDVPVPRDPIYVLSREVSRCESA